MGLDRRTAYCDVGRRDDEVCYDPAKIDGNPPPTKSPTTSVPTKSPSDEMPPPTKSPTTSAPTKSPSDEMDGLGLCEWDCDKDSDCRGDLICADEHKRELEDLGLDKRKANCGDEVPRGLEVCFDPELLS